MVKISETKNVITDHSVAAPVDRQIAPYHDHDLRPHETSGRPIRSDSLLTGLVSRTNDVLYECNDMYAPAKDN